MKEFLSEKNIRFAYVDVTSSIRSFRMFMKVRDTAPSHAEVREEHSDGVPTLVVDDEAYLINSTDDIKKLVEQLHLEDEVDG